MKILITGSTGFLGKSLTKSLIAIYSAENIIPIVRRRSLSNDKSTQVIVQNIDSTTSWEDKIQGVDCVIHCAARVHVMNEIDDDPLEAFREVNLKGTLKLASAAAKAGVKRFIFISSIKVNGESTSDQLPYNSSDEPQPKDPYGVSKAEAENGLKLIADETGMEMVIIRPPLIYGPGVKANFAAMLKLVSTGIPLPFGCLDQNQRSMVFVGNLISLILECVNNPNAANQIFLVSDDNDLSTRKFVKYLSTAMGKSGMMLPVPNTFFLMTGKLLGKSAVIERLCGSLQIDLNHTKDTLNWKPPYTVEQGFIATVKHYKDQKNN